MDQAMFKQGVQDAERLNAFINAGLPKDITVLGVLAYAALMAKAATLPKQVLLGLVGEYFDSLQIMSMGQVTADPRADKLADELIAHGSAPVDVEIDALLTKVRRQLDEPEP